MSRRERSQAAKSAAKAAFGDIEGIQGFGVGDGTVRIYIRSASVGAVLPKELNGVPLDLIITEDLAAQA